MVDADRIEKNMSIHEAGNYLSAGVDEEVTLGNQQLLIYVGPLPLSLPNEALPSRKPINSHSLKNSMESGFLLENLTLRSVWVWKSVRDLLGSVC